MTYTIKIEESSPKAKSFISFLKVLKEDYDFIEIEEDVDFSLIETNIDEELSRRYNLFIDDSTGKDWEFLKKELM
jgi:hypothetical protein